ncbi:hypothetical protein JCM13304A_11360 [Desulfothermus okinawensis JCM 13304]
MKLKFILISLPILFILSPSLGLSEQTKYTTITQTTYISPYQNINHFDLRTINLPNVISLIARQLENNINYLISPSSGLLITTLSDLNDLNNTCRLARIIQDGLISYFTNKGYIVKEIELRKNSIIIKKKRGEFVLTRDLSKLMDKYSVQGIVTGTYSEITNNLFFVTIKIISQKDSAILSSISFSIYIPKTYGSLMIPEKIEKNIDKSKLQQKINPKPIGGPVELGLKILSKKNKQDVKLIQKRLKDLGLYNWKIDGIWGKRTQKAMEIFKKVIGLSPYNQWDINTQKKLFKGTNI